MSHHNGTQKEEYPTTAMNSVTGKVLVSDKRYTIDGDVADARGDTAIDVNAGLDVRVASRGCRSALKDSMTDDRIGSHDSSGGGSFHQENPNQTFLRHADEVEEDQEDDV